MPNQRNWRMTCGKHGESLPSGTVALNLGRSRKISAPSLKANHITSMLWRVMIPCDMWNSKYTATTRCRKKSTMTASIYRVRYHRKCSPPPPAVSRSKAILAGDYLCRVQAAMSLLLRYWHIRRQCLVFKATYINSIHHQENYRSRPHQIHSVFPGSSVLPYLEIQRITACPLTGWAI